MPLIDHCPHCNTAHVHAEERLLEVFDGKQPGLLWRVMRCQNPTCRKLVLGTSDARGEILSLYPTGSYELPADVPMPTELRDDFRWVAPVACLQATGVAVATSIF